ncbi:MAG TPA: cytoplasmic protein [Nitrospiraceae bacterium]|nr:cytoplasmic protein [Nitrospiraceae bacterium]
MNRRKFVKSAAITIAGLSVPNFIDSLVSDLGASERIDLAVARGASPAKITRAAVDAMGGMKKFVSRGDIVVVKPNMAWDRTPEQAGNTNPEVVAEVVKMCFEAGAKKVKVFDRTVNDPRRCYVQSGISDAVKALGADISYVDERKFKEMNVKGEAMKTWPLYTELFEADKVINIPIAKHHSLATLTMSMKNWMGVMGGSRRQIHQRLDESLVDLSGFIKPTLTILDAVRILTANGPQGGNLADVKKLDTVIAGVDQVAVDSLGATLFGMKGSDLGYVKMADKRGLGTMDIAKLKIKKVNI